jgi:hypothetical protein
MFTCTHIPVFPSFTIFTHTHTHTHTIQEELEEQRLIIPRESFSSLRVGGDTSTDTGTGTDTQTNTHTQEETVLVDSMNIEAIAAHTQRQAVLASLPAELHTHTDTDTHTRTQGRERAARPAVRADSFCIYAYT